VTICTKRPGRHIGNARAVVEVSNFNPIAKFAQGIYLALDTFNGVQRRVGFQARNEQTSGLCIVIALHTFGFESIYVGCKEASRRE